MANYNKVTLLGNLSKDNEIRNTNNGGQILNGSIAVNRVFLVDGERRERASFIDFTIFGKRAETFAKYTKKGDQTLLEGRLEQETWETKEGKKRSRLVVYVDTFQFLAPKVDGDVKKSGKKPVGPPHRKTNPPEQNPIDYDDEVPF